MSLLFIFIERVNLFFLLITPLVSFSQIDGPSEIHVGQATSYNVLSWNPTSAVIWAVNSPLVQIAENPNNPGTKEVRVITALYPISQCQIILSAKFEYTNIYNNYATEEITVQKTIKILPFIINPTANVYVGSTSLFGIQDNCGNTGCTYNWNVAPANLCASPCNAASSTFLVTCPSFNFPNFLTLNCTMSCSNNQPSIMLRQVNLPIKLGPINGIVGYSDIGCNFAPPVTYPLVYSISNVVGANNYFWSVPNFMTILSGQGTTQITVNAIGSGIGNITLQAFAGGQSLVTSNVITKEIRVCCTPFLNLSNNVASNSTDNREAAIQIIAVNNVYSGASASYKAGSEVRLSPNFHCANGSTFKAFIGSCTGGGGQSEKTSIVHPGSDSTLNVTKSPEVNNAPQAFTSSEDTFGIKLFPNPNQGIFSLTFKWPITGDLSVYNQFGIKVHTESIQNKKHIQFQLNSLSKGIYFVKIFPFETESLKFIVQ